MTQCTLSSGNTLWMRGGLFSEVRITWHLTYQVCLVRELLFHAKELSKGFTLHIRYVRMDTQCMLYTHTVVM